MLNFDFLFGVACGFMFTLVFGLLSVTENAVVVIAYATVTRWYDMLAQKFRGWRNNEASSDTSIPVNLPNVVSTKPATYDTPVTFTSANEPLFLVTEHTEPSTSLPIPSTASKTRRGRRPSTKKSPSVRKPVPSSKTRKR